MLGWPAHAHTDGEGLKAKPPHHILYVLLWLSSTRYRSSAMLNWNYVCVVLDTLVVYLPTHLVRRIIPGLGASLAPCNTIRGCWGGLRMRVRWGWGSKRQYIWHCASVVVQSTLQKFSETGTMSAFFDDFGCIPTHLGRHIISNGCGSELVWRASPFSEPGA